MNVSGFTRPLTVRRIQLLGLISLFLVFSLSFKPNFLSQVSFLKGDSLSYLAHSMTIALDFDINYKNEVVQGAIHQVPAHPIGAGLLAAPFVGVFYQLDRVNEHPIINDRTRYKSSWTLVGYIFSGIFYFFSGVYLYIRLVRSLFPERSIVFLLLGITSSGVIYFVLNVPFLSHSYEFFSLALLSFLTFRSIEHPSVYSMFMVLLAMVLALFVRYNNLSAILLPWILTSFIFLNTASIHKRVDFKKHIKIYSLMGLMSAFLFGLGLEQLYGVYYPSITAIYGAEASMSLAFLSGHELLLEGLRKLCNFPLLLFGWEFGLIFSNPVLVFSLFGLLGVLFKNLFTGYQVAMSLILLTLLVLAYGLSIGIVLWWESSASTYGYRYLFTTMPLCLVGLYFVLEVFERLDRYKKNALAAVLISFFCFSSFSQFFANTTPALSYTKGVNSYGIERDFVYREYSKNFIMEVVKPNTWIVAFAKGPLGLLAAPVIDKTWLSDFFDNQLLEQYRKHYVHLGISEFAQVFFLFFVWMFIGRGVLLEAFH